MDELKSQPKQKDFDIKTATLDIVNTGLSKNSTMEVRYALVQRK